MSDQYMKELLRVAVAQICQTIGYNATQTAPLELLQDVLDKFLREFTRDLRRQVEHYNRTEANLNDVTLTLDSINVNLSELLDYINNVEPVPFALEVPKFPARKDSYLNFLKPGSKEVLTRPVHVHDHLPPMLPPEITQQPETPLPSTSNCLGDMKPFPDSLHSAGNNSNLTTGESGNDPANKSINPSAVLDKSTLQSLFKPSSNLDDGERPTREVSSVVMTTGGYISPAVEGKMPEAIVPDIIDKLLGLDAPPPPPPPPPSRPPSRSATSTPIPPVTDAITPTINKDTPADKDIPPATPLPTTTSKESKKALNKTLDEAIANKKLELLKEKIPKKEKLFNASKGFPQHEAPPHIHPGGNYSKKSFMMHQNAAGMHTAQTNYANMLLKKAKKQKIPLMPGQPMGEKHGKPVGDKMGKLDAADKAHRKYMKMLQKMAKQGKIPPEVLSNIMGPDKKSKMINPGIVASMPPGPEKLQLEKLLRKQAKQRQKIMKQQISHETQKQSKKLIQPPPLVPIFPLGPTELVTKPLQVNLEEHKLKMEQKDALNISPVKSAFTPNIITPPHGNLMPESLLNKNLKTPVITETPPLEIMETPKMVTTADGKEHKLSNEPDRTKLNIFKKISKQKTPKSSSPTPMRIPGLGDTPIINLPSGTTITPAPGPSTASLLSTSSVGRNLFPPLPDATTTQAPIASNLMNFDNIKDKPALIPSANVNPNQPTDLTTFNRVFGEKPNDAEIINKPKKRGRKPGSKNSPKIPGVIPNSLLKKNSKKFKMDNTNIFGPQMALPPEFAAAAAAAAATGGNLTFDNVAAQLFGNPINPLEWAQQKQLQQQMMIMAAAKERKEHKKKNKILKQDLLNNDNNMASMNMAQLNAANTPTNSSLAVPTNEEVQSINKKLMRMDTILKPAPLASLNQPNDLSIDTSLITGKKLPSPSMFPTTTSANSPLKSPGNSKRLLAGVDAMTAASLAQPFMLPNRQAFPNLPSNMLSMLQFPFPTRPGLIPTPGLFPTPGLGGFPNNPKNPLLPGMFPFPTLKQPSSGNAAINQESEDLTTDKKKSESNLQNIERSYCNVAPLVPEFLTKLSESSQKHHEPHQSEMDLPKTPKPRNSHSNTLSQENLIKKIVDAHTPESTGGSNSGKSLPSTPGGISLNTFEQLMKKTDSPMDLMTLNKQAKSLPSSQESGLDFSMNKKQNHAMTTMQTMGIKTPITLNNEPIEVSDDSDETNQQQPPPPPVQQTIKPQVNLPPAQVMPTLTQLPPQQPLNPYNMDEMFVANAPAPNPLPKSMETDIANIPQKELKKLKNKVKKSSNSITGSLINTDKSESGGGGAAGGVGKLAGGADLIPLASTGLAYSSKNIPFNSLTANANPSFNSHKTDFNATTSAPATTSVFDNLTITAAIPSSSSGSTASVFDLQKKRKEHKKLKKLKEIKEGKIKKKKDKKDKTKSKEKEKAEKYLLTQTHTLPAKEKEPPVVIEPVPSTTVSSSSALSVPVEKIKDKELLKKIKKEKKKEKQRSTIEELPQQSNTQPLTSNTFTMAKDFTTPAASSSTAVMESETKKQKSSPPSSQNSSSSGNEQESAAKIAKTTTTAPASNPVLPAVVPKLTLKLGSTHSPTPPLQPVDDSHKVVNITPAAVVALSPPREQQREPSPELARISPLVTRPPKHKLNTSGELATSSSATTSSISASNASTLEIGDSAKTSSSTSNPNMIVPPPSPWLSGGTISASSVLLPHQLLQTTKQHDLTTTPTSATHTTDPQKTTNTDRQSPLTLITETSRPSSYIDAEGNRVWICPACGKVDDGSPMIGCDGCDAWYHWVCVGIFVAPKDNEDWFCRVCITRKKGLHGSDKKRKRNKKK